jgi:ABC-2 type transport system ATP-binding protein
MDFAVEVVALRREFPGKTRRAAPVVALADVDLTIAPGEIHGLLGPNGAGKTTLVKVLSTILIPTAGSARVLGEDVVAAAAEVRTRIGLVFGGDRGLYARLTGRQNLEYWAALYRVPAREVSGTVGSLLERVGLGARGEDRVETYSRGMKQRLHLARGLVATPQVLFLDEPTVGLDPMASLEFRRLVTELRATGTTILLTTHDMAEAEAVCDRVSLIDHGHILATERPATLGTWLAAFGWVEGQNVPTELVGRLEGLAGTAEARPDDWMRFLPATEAARAEILRELVAAGVTAVRTGYPSLEEVYVRLIGDRGMHL